MEEGVKKTDGPIGGGERDADAECSRALLRTRWELASVLNFLRVFRSVIGGKLIVTGDEVEDALMCPDDVLARIHVALLKGIPPVSKNVEAPEAWVSLTCKQMDMWWSWVADGEAPIPANQGSVVPIYKMLDPLSRLRILKALCEIRAVQDDIIDFIDETLKSGSSLSTFRKDKLGTDSDGYSYWWDGDNVMGYRLYRERIGSVDEQKSRGKSSFTEPSAKCQWETFSCDHDQFQDILVRLSESKAIQDVAIAERLKNELVPLVEKMQKRKERALKRQQRVSANLMEYSEVATGSRRSCRDRKPAKYTFDDFDRTIDEALQIERKRKVVDMKMGTQDMDHTTRQKVNENEKDTATSSEDEDYDDKSSDGDDSGDDNSEIKSDQLDDTEAKQKKPSEMIDTTGLRRSTRNLPFSHQPSCAVDNGHAEMKKRLRERPVHNTDYGIQMVSDSEEDSSSDRGETVDVLLHTGVSPAPTAVR